MGAKAANAKWLWKCPKCGREFKQKSAYHGCGQYTVEGYLAGKNPAGLALYELLTTEAKKFPGVIICAAKTQITFRVRANFLMVSVSGRAIHGYVMLPRAVAKPYFKKIVAASSRRHAHIFRIDDPQFLEDFRVLLPEAVALVSDREEKPPKTTERKSTIGEEINALYRADRNARRLAGSAHL
jgi:hypothetical protein